MFFTFSIYYYLMNGKYILVCGEPHKINYFVYFLILSLTKELNSVNIKFLSTVLINLCSYYTYSNFYLYLHHVCVIKVTTRMESTAEGTKRLSKIGLQLFPLTHNITICILVLKEVLLNYLILSLPYKCCCSLFYF